MSSKKLLFDLTPLDTPSGPRGIGRYIRELALGLAALPKEELGDVELVGLTALTWTGGYRITDDIGSYRGGARSESPTEADFYEWAWRQRVALWRAASRVGAAAVHVCDPHATPLFLGWAGCKRIVTCHDLVPTRFPDRYFGVRDGGAFIGKRIERRRYRSADLVVAVSDATRADAIELLAMPPERIVRVHESVNVGWWAEPPGLAVDATLERLGLARRAFVLYVGGYDWRKNAEGMMAGLAHARERGAELELVWAGHLQPGHVQGVEDAARRFGVLDFVRRVGYVSDEDLAALHRAARALLFVSRYEGFGLPVIEAMASGCPVITTNAGSLAEIAGDAAIKVDPEDAAAIGDALVRLASDSPLRADLVVKGRAQARRFSREAQAHAMARLYRDFLAEAT